MITSHSLAVVRTPVTMSTSVPGRRTPALQIFQNAIYCAHSSNAAGSPRKCARTSPAKCSEPVIRMGFGFARASINASPSVEVMEQGSCWSDVGYDFCQFLRRDGAFTADFRQDHRTGNRRERFADTAQIFVGKNREHERRLLIAKNFPPRFLPECAQALGLCAPSMIVRSSHF